MSEKRSGRLRSAAGYTVTEALTVVGAMGVVAAFTVPNVLQLKAAMEVQEATSQVSGALQRTRARAASEGIPFLFLVQHEEASDGTRSAFALIVRDNDRSYSVTPPDDVETFVLDAELPAKIRQYGEAPEPIYSDIPRAYGDATAVYARGVGSTGSSGQSASAGGGSGGVSGLLGGVGEVVGGLLGGGGDDDNSDDDDAGDYRTSEASLRESEPLSASVMNGATFPVAEDAGVPGIAFNERGIPVSLNSPKEWGSGAGAIYLTDNERAVYASVVSPLGEISTSRYDADSASWK